MNQLNLVYGFIYSFLEIHFEVIYFSTPLPSDQGFMSKTCKEFQYVRNIYFKIIIYFEIEYFLTCNVIHLKIEIFIEICAIIMWSSPSVFVGGHAWIT